MHSLQDLLSSFPGATPGKSDECVSVDLPIDTYHSMYAFISHTGMKELLRSPAHYHAYLGKGGDRGVTPNFGSAAHMAVLEPEAYARSYVVFEGRRAGKAFDEFRDAHIDKQILNRDEADRIEGILRSLREFSDFPVMDAFGIGESEKSIFWRCKETGACCRIRTDSLNPFAIFDLKTIDDARPTTVLQQIMRSDYDLQAYLYTSGVREFTGESLPFNFVFVEDKSPHGVWLYTAGASLLASGREKFLRGAKAFTDIERANLLQSYSPAFSIIEAPAWRRRELAQLMPGTVVDPTPADSCYL